MPVWWYVWVICAIVAVVVGGSTAGLPSMQGFTSVRVYAVIELIRWDSCVVWLLNEVLLTVRDRVYSSMLQQRSCGIFLLFAFLLILIYVVWIRFGELYLIYRCAFFLKSHALRLITFNMIKYAYNIFTVLFLLRYQHSCVGCGFMVNSFLDNK